MTINRRSLITGLISLVAAPAIVRATNLMPVKTIMDTWTADDVTWTADSLLSRGNWHLSFWCSGKDFKLGDEVEMHGQRFAVDSVETISNHTGKIWHHVTGIARHDAT